MQHFHPRTHPPNKNDLKLRGMMLEACSIVGVGANTNSTRTRSILMTTVDLWLLLFKISKPDGDVNPSLSYGLT